MFHKRTGHITATILLLSLCAQPITSFAAQARQAPTLKETVITKVDEFSLEQFRQDTKAKLSETQEWVQDVKGDLDLKAPFEDLDMTIDRLQDNVKPAGASMKASLKKVVPGEGLVRMGERKVSVFGLMLAMAFGLVVILLSLAGPGSRLGGRH